MSEEYITELETVLYEILKADNINVMEWDHRDGSPCVYAKPSDLKRDHFDKLRKRFNHLLINGPSKIHKV